jgi:hypothetical protein
VCEQSAAESQGARLKAELDGMQGTLCRIERTLSQVAGAAQMETLGCVVEEQRLRIDSILRGKLNWISDGRRGALFGGLCGLWAWAGHCGPFV